MSRKIVLARAVCAVAVVVTAVAVVVPASHAATAPPPGGAFRPLRAARLLDTRQSQVAPKAAGSFVNVTVAGRGGVPSTGVAAVVLNVTTVAPTGTGSVTVFPTGATRPTTNNLRFTSGKTVSNLVTVAVGSLGRASLYLSGAASHLLVDVQGWYTTPGATTGTAGLLKPIRPARVLNTRSAIAGTPIPAKGTHTVSVAGLGGVPQTGVGAVILNVIAYAPTASGALTVWQAGATKPTVSNVSFAAAQTVGNRVVVGVSSVGAVSIYNSSASPVDVLADVSGWFTNATTNPSGAGYFNALPSRRAYNTGTSPLGTTPRTVKVTGLNGVPTANVVAVALTTTVVNPSAAGYVRTYPAEPPTPTADQYHKAGLAIANHAIAKPSATGTVQLRNSAGTLQALVDTSGYYLRLPPPRFATTALPNGTEGLAYDQQLAGTGGNTPYTYTFVSGSLAPGLTLEVSGRYFGTPTTAGSYSMVLRITDAWGESATKSFTHVIELAPAPLAVTTTSLPSGQTGSAYSATLAATGGTPGYTWTLASNSAPLPAGLSLAPSTGAITGTPSAAGTSNVTFRVTDSAARTAAKTLSITITATPVPTVTTTSLPNGQTGSAYNATLTATGGTPGYTWTVAAGSAPLPAGLSLAPSTGAITGTPSAAGTSNVTFRVTDSASQTATKTLSITIATTPVPTITTASLPNGQTGSAYSATLTATGGTPGYTWTLAAGSAPLPAGLSLATSTGAISGTPSASGTSSVTFRVTDANAQTATKALSITIAAIPAPTVTTTSLPGGRLSTAYQATLAASGGTTPYVWTSVGTALPPGLSLSATGVLSGTPTTTGAWSPTFRVTDANQQTAQATLPIAVTAGSDWTQPHADMGRTGYAPQETAITAANATDLREVWSLDAASNATAVAGGVLYTAGSLPGEPGETALTAYDIVTSAVLWRVQLTCGAGDVAVTPSAVLLSCSGRLRAYDRTGSHALLWDTAVTDPGSGSANDFAVMNDRVVVVEHGAVYGYRLSDGVRLWRQFLPSGAMGQQVAVSGTTAVVAMGDALRTYSTTNGAAGWVKAGNVYSVIADAGALYTATDGELRRLALSDGAQQWATATGGRINGVLGGNGSKVLALWRQDADLSIETRTQAYDETNGAFAWESYTPNRVMHVAITPSLAWVTTADYGGMVGSDSGAVSAVSMADGTVVHSLGSGRRIFSASAISDGRIVVARSTSLRVFSLDRPIPSVTTKVLRSGHVAAPYSDTLTAGGGTAPYTWSITSGTLPAGITLNGSTGTIAGTPTAASAPRVTIRVTDALGAVGIRRLVVQISPTGGPGSWPTIGGNDARTGLAATETTIGLDSAPQLGPVWASETLATIEAGDLAVAGDKIYVSQAQTGTIKAYSRSAGGTTGRTALWTAQTDDDNQHWVQTGITVSGGRLLIGTLQGLYSFNAETGAKQWQGAYTQANPGGSAPLVIGTRVFVGDGDGGLHAFNLADGTPVAGWAPFAPQTYPGVPRAVEGLATDGTRLFAASACTLYALAPATGATLWSKVLTPTGDPSCAYAYKSVPLVAGGIVYAGSQSGTMAFDAVTGAVVWQRSIGSGGSMALSNGTLLITADTGGAWELRAVDALTGELLWRSISAVGPGRVVVAGDLVLTNSGDGIRGVDIRTGDTAWAGTPAGGGYGLHQPAVVDGVIYHVGFDRTLRAYGVPA